MLRFLLILVLSAAALLADPASRLYKEGRRAERRGDELEAFTLYTRAAGMKPGKEKYWRRAEQVRVRAAQGLAALNSLEGALALDPDNSYLQARLAAGSRTDAPTAPAEAEMREAEQAAAPIRLRPALARHAFYLRGDARTLYEQVFRAYGLEVVFDPDFIPGS
ncbi:MAG: hypothetical protein HY236_09045, partial [Acidobacteria bacterium]|nr:hypothetical protein [Acidobacteriota bacterium]